MKPLYWYLIFDLVCLLIAGCLLTSIYGWKLGLAAGLIAYYLKPFLITKK